MAGSPENEGPFGRDSGFGGSHDFQAGSAVSFQGKWDPMVSLYMAITVPKRWVKYIFFLKIKLHGYHP